MSITLKDFLIPLKTINTQIVLKDLEQNVIGKIYADTISSLDSSISERTVNRWDIVRNNLLTVYLNNGEEPVIVPVEAVILQETTISLNTGESVTLVADVYPENATNKNVTWISTDENLATVEDGLVTALADGEVQIIVTTEDGGFTDMCTVTITTEEIKTTGITLSASELSMFTDSEPFRLIATVEPENSTEPVIWSMSEEGIISLSDGVITPIIPGSVVVSATSGDFVALCSVTVADAIIQVESVTINTSEVNVEEGSESIVLTATVLPEDATDKTVTWASSDDTVATIDENGLLTIVGIGVANITASAGDVVSEPCIVTVSQRVISVDSVSLNEETLELLLDSEPITLVATVLPENASNKNVTWNSDNEEVVTVSEGIVTVVGEGSAVITVITEDGNHSASCSVTVSS